MSGGARLEDVADVGQRLAVPRAACERRRAGRCDCRSAASRWGDGRAHRFVVREVDQLVLGEPRVQHDVHQTLQAGRPHRRHARDGIRIEHAVTNDPQTARTLGHEDRAVGQKRDRPGLVEVLRHYDQAQTALFGGLQHDRAVGERRRRPVDRQAARTPPTAGRLRRRRGRRLLCAGGHDEHEAEHEDQATGGMTQPRRARHGVSPWISAPSISREPDGTV